LQYPHVCRGVCHGLSNVTLAVLLCALSACSTAPKQPEAGSAAAAEKMTESLNAADKAQKLGKTEDALAELDTAIKVDPASKQPWLRKAQIYFDARQYGQAITAAQETLQRDTTDLTAKSILAVSGLRVSAQALEQLRKANEVNGSARTEAESVAKLIREALGEPILVPPVAAASGAETKPNVRATAVRRVSPPRPMATASAPVVVSAAKPPVASPVATLNAAPPAAGGRNNPFGALK
jgi:tetratricopeptide (TPR) repeat protein